MNTHHKKVYVVASLMYNFPYEDIATKDSDINHDMPNMESQNKIQIDI